MKKTAIRVIAIALVLLMALALIPLAAWADGTYTVHFEKNAEDATGEMPDQSFPEGEEVALTPCGFTRNGYTCTGWTVNADGSGTFYSNGASYEISQNLTLYAKWLANPAVVYCANYENGPENVTQKVPYNTSTKLTPPTFSRGGYSLTGWHVNADGSGTYYNGTESVTLTQNLTLYAQWQQDAPAPTVYTLRFDGNGGGGSMEAMTNTTGVFTLPGCTFGKEGSTFLGWSMYDVAESTASLMAPESSFTLPTGSTEWTVYAQWTANSPETYTITLNPNGGSVNPTSIPVVAGNQIGTLPVPSWQDNSYIFAGWLDNNTGASVSSSMVPQGSMTLTANWVQNSSDSSTRVVHLNGNGGDGSMADLSAPAETAILAPANGFTPPANMIFTGWNTAANGSGTPYAVGAPVGFNAEFSAAEVTLYAQWGSAAPAALTGTVTISGTPNPGEVLTASLTGSNNTGVLSYQWLRDDSPISGETGQNYTVKNSDLQKRIACRVTSSVQTGNRTSTAVTVYPVSKGTAGTSTPVKDNSFPENKIAALKQRYGNVPGIKAEAYAVSACWNDNPNSPMTPAEVTENGPISFMLPYPAGTSADGSYDFHVYHFGSGAANPDEVSCAPAIGGLLVSSGAFSDFVTLAVPSGAAPGQVLVGGSAVVGGTLSVILGDGVTPTGYQWTRAGNNILNANGATYTVSSADVGYRIAVKVNTAGGVIDSANYVVPTAKVDPKVTQGVYNDGETGTGIISNVDSSMEYIFWEDYQKNPGSAKWKPVSGTQITGLTKGGLYYVQLKDNPGSRVSVEVPSYYSIRVYEKVKNTRYTDAKGNSVPRHGSLDPEATIVEAGTTLTVAAKPNKNYAVYDILINDKSAEWSRSGGTYYVKVKDINERTYVDVKFVYTGSSPRTGDDSHIGTWSALATLSLMGAGAALVILKRKSRA